MSDGLIHVAENPVLAFSSQLGRDELYAAAVGAALTGAAYFAIETLMGGEKATGLLAMVLPLVAPICEKPGLIIHYVKEGFEDWRRLGGGLGRRIWRRLTDGRAMRTIRADLLFHDPAYMGLMALGIWALAPDTWWAAGFLSVLSFCGALGLAAAAEVMATDFTFRRLVARLRKAGFESEDYYESKYLVADPQACPPDQFLEALAAEFDLPDAFELTYEDSYFPETSLVPLNGREPSLRLRRTSGGDTGGLVSERAAVQVVLTRPEEIGRNDLSLFRCFAIRKMKHSRRIDTDVSGSVAVRDFARGAPLTPIRFRRKVVRDKKGLYASVDVLEDGNRSDAYWVEIKVRRDLNLLKRANEFVAMNFPVRGTTRGKAVAAAALKAA